MRRQASNLQENCAPQSSIARQRNHNALIATLLLTSSLTVPTIALADDLIIDFTLPGFDPSRTNGAIALPGPGDTLVLTEGTPIVIRDAAGIDVFRADDVVVTNNGSIFTTGTNVGVNNLDPNSFGYGDGIFVFESANATIINNGLVSIGDFFANGLYQWQGENSTTINNGEIVIREDILEPDPDGRINPDTGQPFLTAGASAGIRIDSYENREDENLPSVGLGGHYAENNGTITSFAVQSRGMYIDGANFWTIDDDNDPNTPDVTDDAFFSVDSTLVNNGQILMLATTPSSGIFDASGMRAEAHNATLINKGYIEVRTEGFGIDYNGANGTVWNYGTILAFNEDSHGIEHYRNGTTVPVNLGQSFTGNMGSILVQGANNHGVSLTGHVGHDFVNSGTIFSLSGYSIEAGDGNQPLLQSDQNIIRLLDGSLLFGDVFVDALTAQYTSMHLGDGLNATVRFEDDVHVGNGRQSGLPDQFWSHHDAHVFDAATNAVYVADLDSYAQQDQAFWHLTSQMQDRLDQGFAGQNSPQDRWIGLFGGALLAEPKDAAPAYNAYSTGVVAGTHDTPIGFFGGIAGSIVTGQEEISYETRLATAFGGISGKTSFGITYSIAAGLAFNETKREVADNGVSGGIEADTTTYPAIFIAPSLSVDGPVSGSSARLRFNAMWQGGHSFSFPNGTHLSVDDRFAGSIEARLQMASDMGFAQLTYGVDGIWSLGPEMAFDLMGVGLSSPYDEGITSRAFARVDGRFWHAELGYDTDQRATAGIGSRIGF